MNQLASAKAIYWFREVKRVVDSFAQNAFVGNVFSRKFGEDVVAVYMQEVNDEEQALYARLVTRSLVALEAIVDGGRVKYNINEKHVWAKKYVKKQILRSTLMDKPVLQLHPLQTNVPVWNIVL
ncbi:hypothetical protein RND71_025660 [Anisodus tanguticus]|uniref:Uncharacterized protein n=1 Tax=Anisodus tanguticus TaxID=243964 RepID=A0AAE1RT10_9SOLA|nr:hypothetical protein RND71_025660 [Anisodus tanguticus]